MRRYQCILLFDPMLDDESLTKEITSIEGFITNNNGSIENKSIPKKIEMGYKIKKRKEGHYMVVDFRLEPTKIKELDGALKLNEAILRCTFVANHEKEIIL